MPNTTTFIALAVMAGLTFRIARRHASRVHARVDELKRRALQPAKPPEPYQHAPATMADVERKPPPRIVALDFMVRQTLNMYGLIGLSRNDGLLWAYVPSYAADMAQALDRAVESMTHASRRQAASYVLQRLQSELNAYVERGIIYEFDYALGPDDIAVLSLKPLLRLPFGVTIDFHARSKGEWDELQDRACRRQGDWVYTGKEKELA